MLLNLRHESADCVLRDLRRILGAACVTRWDGESGDTPRHLDRIPASLSLSDRPSEHSCAFSKTQSSHIPLTPITQPRSFAVCLLTIQWKIIYTLATALSDVNAFLSVWRQQNWTDIFCSIVFGMRIDYKRQPFHTVSKQLWQYDCFVNNGAQWYLKSNGLFQAANQSVQKCFREAITRNEKWTLEQYMCSLR